MAEMGKYCKAYYVKDFRAIKGWEENLEALRPETREEDGQEVEVERTELEDDDILYLHDSYIVTDGIFTDENIIFDKVTDIWKAACHEELGFEIPVDEPIDIPRTADEADGDEAAST
ncbi:MAG: hypothetical protein GY719_36830 [bacterium]|nr:hypothetical protein [bacterium]